MTAIEFCGYLHGEPAALKRLRDIPGIGRSGEKIPSQADEDLHTALVHGFDRAHRIQTMFFRRREVEFLAEGGEIFRAHLLPDPHRPVSLHVAVATDGTNPRPLSADLSSEQREINDMVWTFATPLRCCVTPMAQEQIMRSDSIAIFAAC